MAACGSLEHIFDKPLPENPTLLESLSPWNRIKSMKTNIDDSSFTEIFGELHFNEHNNNDSNDNDNNQDVHPLEPTPSLSPQSSISSWPDTSSSPRPGIDIPKKDNKSKNSNSSSYNYNHTPSKKRHSDSFSSMNSESLSLCTEGLGFESFDDVEDLLNCNNVEWQAQDQERKSSARSIHTEYHHCNYNDAKKTGESRSHSGGFPPPISCIGRSGKPWVCLKSYREDGRFILKEVKIPTQEFLHACRENGRLKLQFIHSDDEILEEDEYDDDDDDDDDSIQEHDDQIGDENVEKRDCNMQGSS